ncbi:MAG: stage II sporulation protein M [Brevinematia bacterium]
MLPHNSTDKSNLIILASSVLISVSSFLSGYFSHPLFLDKWMNFVKGYINEIPFNFFSIFINNFFISFLMISGGFIFGLPTLFFAGLNFFSLGVSSRYFIEKFGAIIFFISIIPHGIFELTGVFLSLFYGIRIFVDFMLKSSARNLDCNLSANRMILKLKRYILTVLPLFFIAALIEVYITPLIIAYVISHR